MQKYCTFLLSLLFCFSIIRAEDAPKLTYSAYVESYVAFDNAQIQSKWNQDAALPKFRQFAVSDNLKNELGLNIAQFSANMDYKGMVRGKFTIHTGNLAEMGFGSYAPNIQEAYLGFKLMDGFWLDAGYYFTHIGGEVFLPKDNWFSSHSMVTYFEPFYEAGLKAQYETGPFTFCLHFLNSYNTFAENNDNKTLGAYVKYAPSALFNISYAGVFGNEEPGGSVNAKTHLLHNLCIESHPSEKLGIKAQVDYSTKADLIPDGNSFKQGTFMAAGIQAKYQLSNPFACAVRASYFDNMDGVESADLVKGIEATLGLEYKPLDKSYIRLEGRLINMDDKAKVFIDADKKPTGSRMDIMLNFGFWID